LEALLPISVLFFPLKDIHHPCLCCIVAAKGVVVAGIAYTYAFIVVGSIVTDYRVLLELDRNMP